MDFEWLKSLATKLELQPESYKERLIPFLRGIVETLDRSTDEEVVSMIGGGSSPELTFDIQWNVALLTGYPGVTSFCDTDTFHFLNICSNNEYWRQLYLKNYGNLIEIVGVRQWSMNWLIQYILRKKSEELIVGLDSVILNRPVSYSDRTNIINRSTDPYEFIFKQCYITMEGNRRLTYKEAIVCYIMSNLLSHHLNMIEFQPEERRHGVLIKPIDISVELYISTSKSMFNTKIKKLSGTQHAIIGQGEEGELNFYYLLTLIHRMIRYNLRLENAYLHLNYAIAMSKSKEEFDMWCCGKNLDPETQLRQSADRIYYDNQTVVGVSALSGYPGRVSAQFTDQAMVQVGNIYYSMFQREIGIPWIDKCCVGRLPGKK